MKNTLSAFLFIFLSVSIFAQQNKDISFVLVINGEVISQPLKLSFYINGEKSSDKIDANYIPGTLTMSTAGYENLLSAQTNTIFFKLNETQYIDGKPRYYDYSFEYQKGWLQDTYNVLKIYNLSIKKYRKRFDPITPEKNYTFELTSPNGTFLRLKSK